MGPLLCFLAVVCAALSGLLAREACRLGIGTLSYCACRMSTLLVLGVLALLASPSLAFTARGMGIAASAGLALGVAQLALVKAHGFIRGWPNAVAASQAFTVMALGWMYDGQVGNRNVRNIGLFCAT